MTSQQKENVKALIESLRSGKYTQGTGVLYNVVRGSHCCLGVACEIAIQKGLDLQVHEHTDKSYLSYTHRFYGGEKYSLPDSVLEFFGFTSPEGKCTDKEKKSLQFMNDAIGSTFQDIADFIEKALNTEGHCGLFADERYEP